MKKVLLFGIIAWIGIGIFYSCSKEKSFETGSRGTPATGELKKDSNLNCEEPMKFGTYAINKEMNDSNYVEISVIITKPGTYTISTDTLNGFYFRDSGFFSKNGTQTVRLKGHGTPVSAVSTSFTVSFDTTQNTSQCDFYIDVTDGTPPLVEFWRFSNGSRTISGTFDHNYCYLRDTTIGTDPPVKYLQIGGPSSTASDSFFVAWFKFPTTITDLSRTTSYKSYDSCGFSYSKFTPPTALAPLYLAQPGVSTTTQFLYMYINSYNSTTKEITGTFNGTANINDGFLTPIGIPSGQFVVKLQ